MADAAMAPVMRASLIRCASKLVASGHLRRATVAVSDLAATRAIANVAMQQTLPPTDPDAMPSGPDPLASVLTSGEIEGGGVTKREVDGWGAIPPYVAIPAHLEEEPQPFGERAVAAASTAEEELE